MVTASTVVAYAIYTASPEVQEKLGTEKLYFTLPFVLFGIFRYLYLVQVKGQGGAPEDLLFTDRSFLVDIVLWGISVFLVMYVFYSPPCSP